MGERVLFPEVRKAGISTLVLADGFSSREQIHQDTPPACATWPGACKWHCGRETPRGKCIPKGTWSEKERRGGVVPCNAQQSPPLRSSLAALSYGKVSVA